MYSRSKSSNPVPLRLAAICILVAAAPPAGANPTQATKADEAVDATGPALLAPSLGRPAFVEPGGQLQIRARLATSATPVHVELVRPGAYELRYPLDCVADAAQRLDAGQPLTVRVPPSVPCQTYDLLITCAEVRLQGRHCVAVGRFGRSLRVVHLANMNVGDPAAPGFDERLIEEINLLAPTFIVAAGDYLDATHRDPRAGWQRAVEFFSRFDAPTVMACGDHDDMTLYSRHVAPSPIGLVDIGPNRCLVIFDHASAPIQNDRQQLGWIERTLTRPGFDGITLVASHGELPGLLDYWRSQGTLTQMISAGRVGVWLSGGHCDWDGREYAELIHAAAPMVYLRTHESSTAPRGGATGVSHYRIVDIVENRVLLPGATSGAPGTPSSTPTGYLRANLDRANDGSASRIAFSATNNLPYRLDGLAQTLRLRKQPGYQPWCHGGRMEQAIDLGDTWECRIRFDLPDKGALRAVVGSGSEPAAPAAIAQIEASPSLRFQRRVSPQGLSFCALEGDSPLVHVRNAGAQPASLSPVARLDGSPIAYRPLNADTRFATRYRLHLGAGETTTLQLDLSAFTVAPGRRDLQVYLQGEDVMIPFCQAVEVEVVD